MFDRRDPILSEATWQERPSAGDPHSAFIGSTYLGSLFNTVFPAASSHSATPCRCCQSSTGRKAFAPRRCALRGPCLASGVFCAAWSAVPWHADLSKLLGLLVPWRDRLRAFVRSQFSPKTEVPVCHSQVFRWKFCLRNPVLYLKKVNKKQTSAQFPADAVTLLSGL